MFGGMLLYLASGVREVIKFGSPVFKRSPPENYLRDVMFVPNKCIFQSVHFLHGGLH